MFNPKNYSPYWKQFNEFVRFERANYRCECRGVCGRNHQGRCAAINDGIGKMGMDGIWRTETAIHNLNSSEGMRLYPNFNFIGTKVCLTVAHLDYEGGICDCKTRYGFKCAKPTHVLALCNFCHLMLDLPHHIEKRRENLMVKKDSERMLFQIPANL